MPRRFRLLVLLGTLCSMRWGELAALQRRDVDTRAGWVLITRAVVELGDGKLLVGEPKTAAGRRVVAIPTALLGDITDHLEEFVASGDQALVFTGFKGAMLRRSNVHFHDLRHTGNTLASRAGADLADLMARMGHASPRAARINLHTTSQRDRAVADSLNRLLGHAGGTTDENEGENAEGPGPESES